MNPQKIAQQFLAFQKKSYENFQNVWQLAQAQTSTTVDRLMDQAPWVPQAGSQLLENWRLLIEKERGRYAAFIDRGFAIYEEMAAPSPALSTTNTKTTTSTTDE